MRATLVALLCVCVGAAQARAEEPREDEGKETLQSEGRRRGKEKSGAKEQNKERNE